MRIDNKIQPNLGQLIYICDIKWLIPGGSYFARKHELLLSRSICQRPQKHEKSGGKCKLFLIFFSPGPKGDGSAASWVTSVGVSVGWLLCSPVHMHSLHAARHGGNVFREKHLERNTPF
jgi:hypothetical protein